MKSGVVVPILEDVILDIGEEEALAVAKRIAERRLPGARFVRDARENFARTDPETGDPLPPVRAYFFDR